MLNPPFPNKEASGSPERERACIYDKKKNATGCSVLILGPLGLDKKGFRSTASLFAPLGSRTWGLGASERSGGGAGETEGLALQQP